MQFRAAAKTDVGLIKKVNQDAYHVAIAETELGMVAIAVICDGVGGLSAGEMASSIAVSSFKEWFETKLPQLIEKRQVNATVFQEEFMELLTRAHQKMIAYGKKNGFQCGTTLSLLLLIEDNYYLLHIGDSRIYEIQKEVVQLTKDHTLLEREGDYPGVSEQMSVKSKHVLLQCLGVSAEIHPDFSYGKIKEDSCYLLCSDGLHNRCDLSQLSVEQFKDMEITAQRLIEECKAKNERDNISVIMLSTSK